MAKLKLGALPDNKPVKVSLELPAAVHRDLVAYAEILALEAGQPISDPSKLIVPMVARFMKTDRAFFSAQQRCTKSGEAPPSGNRIGRFRCNRAA
jgi:hypothetical protein